MNSIQNNSISFQSKLIPLDGINAKMFNKANEQLQEMTLKSNEKKLYMWKNSEGYVFGLKRPKADFYPATTQQVGRDTMAYLLLEKGAKDIANFLKTTINVLEKRDKIHSIEEGDFLATEMYLKEKSIAPVLKTVHGGNLNYYRTGENIHVIV